MRDVYKTVWEIPQRAIIDMAADRGAFICQSQSMNVHIGEPSMSKLTSMHFYAWKLGLKTGMYYLRTRPKADAIQFTVNQEMLANTNGAPQPQDMSPQKSPKLAPADVSKPSVSAKFAILQMKDDEEECLSCGA